MKRSTTRWTTAIAAAAWLTVPAAAWAQSAPSQPQKPSPSTTAQQPTSPHAQHGAANEHIRQAQAALNDVQTASLPAEAKTKIAQLKRHLNSLEKNASASASAKPTARGKANWAGEVASIDKILAELLGPATTSATGERTGATGTTGNTGTTKSRPSTSLTLDETAKSKLMEVRTHVTAFAAGMSGAAPGAEAPQPADTPSPGATPSPAQSQPQPEPQPQSPQPQSPEPQSSQPQSSQPQPSDPQPQQQPASGQVNPEEAKRHLTAARDSLNQLTQLPAAAQLQGEARTQVSQLITNFNELITTKENWREAYAKVDANITALIGPEGAAPAETPAPAPAGTPGAVGTTGTASLDPGIRGKLVEFRDHLKKFESSAGGSSSPSESSTPSEPSTPSTTSEPSASPSAAAMTSDQSASAQRPAAAGMGQDAIRHIDAIEAILNGRSASAAGASPTGNPASPTGNPPGATAGTTGTTSGSVTLDRAQLEQIRMHLSELRKIADKK